MYLACATPNGDVGNAAVYVEVIIPTSSRGGGEGHVTAQLAPAASNVQQVWVWLNTDWPPVGTADALRLATLPARRCSDCSLLADC